jgi:hypothetical protein
MIPNPIPVELQCDHLFVLVGGNPVPNWVAARLLLKPGGRLYLVHTAGAHGTAGYADRLGRALRLVPPPVPVLLKSESDAAGIYAAVQEKVMGLKHGQVGLNYTGGTKAMSVHAYRALEDCLPKGLPAPIFSYLEARKFAMMIHAGSGLPVKEYEVRLVQDCALDIGTLYSLHEQYRTNKRRNTPHAAECTPLMLEVYLHPAGFGIWKQWVQDKLRLNWKEFKSNSELNSVTLPADPSIRPLADRLAARSGGLAPTLGNLYKPWGFATLKDFAKWLDGEWLEDYVLERLIALESACDLNDYAAGLKVTVRGRTFEIDALAVRGFQLFYLSCYSGDHYQHSKVKLFEAAMHAQQLGGEEARVALVTLHSAASNLEFEVREAMDNPQSVRVFGRNELKNLQSALEKWITTG